MFSFLKRFFGKMVRKAQAPAMDPIKTIPAESLPVDRIAAQTALLEEPVFVAPAIPAAPALISEEFLRGSIFDDDEEEEELPGDKANLGMVPSIGNPNAYMIGLVGEEHHREAVNSLTEGMPITLQLEPGNPDDPSAIAAVERYGRVIGYISHDSWLREAVYGGGSGFSAWVLAVEMGDRGYREVVLEVEPSERPLRERAYQG
jgi:hypothetical protein